MMRTWKRVLWIAAAAGLAGLSGCVSPAGPLAEFTATPRFDYPPLVVTFDARDSSSPNGAVLSYEWDFGDGDTGTGKTTTHAYTEKGVYTITLLITDSAGKTGSRMKTVEALNRVPVAQFAVNKAWVGTFDPIRFNASDSQDPDGRIEQYIWSFGDGSSDEGVIVEHEYTTPGWDPRVTLTVVDEDGGTASITKIVHVVGCGSCGS